MTEPSLAQRYRELPRHRRWVLRGVFAVLICIGAGRYFEYDLRNLTETVDFYDLTFYYLNSKYYHELGYTGLPEAILVADAGSARRLQHVTRYRELETYRVVSTRRALARSEAIRARFGKARFRQFTRDVEYISAHNLPWQYLFNDHGYNPPPTWTVVGRLLSTHVPLWHAKWITSVDLLLVAAMFMGVAWAFGELPLLCALLFFFWTGSSMWPLVGQALLRFDWLATATLGLAAAHRGRAVLAGALLAYATLVRVFPAILLWPYLVVIGAGLWQARRIDRGSMGLIVGGSLMTAGLCAAALADLGSEAFVEGFQKILLHGGPDSYSSMRVGLGDLLVFHGETTRAAMNLHGGTLGKAELIRAMAPTLRFVGGLSLALIATVTLRLHRQRPWATMALGVIPLYCLTTPNITYFNIRLLLVVSLAALEPSRLRALGGLLLLAVTECLTYYGEHAGLRYYATSLTSVGLAGTFGFLTLGYLYDLVWKPPLLLPQLQGWSRAARAALLCGAMAVIVVPCMLVERDISPKAVAADRLSRRREAHTRWNAPGTVRMRTPIAVQLPTVTHARRVELSADANDDYELRFQRGDRVLARLTIDRSSGYRGLRPHVVDVPAAAAGAGYDTVAVFPVGGDGRYALGHLIPVATGGP